MKVKKYDIINEQVLSKVHQSGLRVYIMPKKGFGKSYATFATNFGSVDNVFMRNGEKVVLPDGIAHFLEHKVFEEPDYNVFAEFSKLGASANAYTSFDLTTYLFSATDNFYDSLKILLSYVQNPYFTDENVAKEQGIIGQEIGMYDDDPEWNVFFNMLRAMYKKHSINIDIAGSVKSISEITKETLYKCYESFYNPANMVLFIVGDVEPDKVWDVVEECIKTAPRPEVEVIREAESDEINMPTITQNFCVAKPIFCMGFKEKPMDDPVWADAVYTILLEMLFGKSSELYQSLYNEGLINAAFSASYSAGKEYAFVEMSSESDNPEKVRDIILGYVAEIKKNRLLKEDFERIKRALYGKVLRSLNSVDSIANQFISMIMRGGDYPEFAQTINKVTFEDIENLLQGALDQTKCVLSVVKATEEGCES